MGNVNEEKIKEKIKKLLRLSQSNNENEAKSAMAKAQELMLEYKLSMAEVDGEKTEVKKISTGIYYSARKDFWKSQLMVYISENYCVGCYITTAPRSSRHEICLMGTETDVQICLDVFKFASEYIEEWFKKYKKENGWKYSSKYLNSVKNDYGIGFALGVYGVLEKQKERKQQEWGLVVTTPKEVQEFVGALKENKSKAVPNTGDDLMIRMQGFGDGQKISFNDKITENNMRG